MKIYTGYGSPSYSPTAAPAPFRDTPAFDYGYDEPEPEPQADENVGVAGFNFGDPVASIGETIGSLGKFASGLTGAIGSIGIPDGPNIGGVVDTVTGPAQFGLEVGQNALGAAGNVLGAVGGVSLPYLGNDPNRRAATLGEVPGMVGDIIGAPLRFVEHETAKNRLSSAAAFGKDNKLPPDLLARAEAGENIDVLAEELVARGEGFSENRTANLIQQVVLDPLNFIAPGVGAGLRGARQAGMAVKAAEDVAALGLTTRFAGKAYNAASHNLSAAGARFVDATIGPVTSGVLRAYGPDNYRSLVNGGAKLDPAYGRNFADALAHFVPQAHRQVVVRWMTDEATDAIRTGREFEGAITTRIAAQKTIGLDHLEREVEHLLLRVGPTWADEATMTAESIGKYAAVTGMSPEDAARVLGKINRGKAGLIDAAFYAKAGDDLARIKAALRQRFYRTDPAQYIVIAPDTLTDEIAEHLLPSTVDNVVVSVSDELLADAVDRYSILRNRFGDREFDRTAILDFVRKMKNAGALPQVARLPNRAGNRLPSALGAWRAEQKRLGYGYELGFAPKDGLKTIIDDATGEVLHSDPFVHFVSEADPVTMRNPLGRFMDSLFRGTTQTAIVLDSRRRFVDLTRTAGLSPNQARAIHRAILDEAAEASKAPRGLASLGPRKATFVVDGKHVQVPVNAFEHAFSRFLSPEEFTDLYAKHNLTFLVMRSLEGDLRRVGLTQKFTGAVKSQATRFRGGDMVPAITDDMYPSVKFKYSPFFQAQELVESPVYNFLRGIRSAETDPNVLKIYEKMAESPEFRYLAEAGYVLHITGGGLVRKATGADTKLGRALSRFADVKARKEANRIAQVLSEHPESFKEAVESINPRFWRTMVEAYGTTDARTIADRFMRERFRLSESVDEAMKAFDEIAPRTFASADEETVWQAFRETFRQTSEQAFTTHYFNPKRGWLERTLNHPFLGLYPLSYTLKVAGEYGRFLLFRPFGLRAPLVGALALTRVQEAILAEAATNPEFEQMLKDNKDLFYGITQLLPGLPTDQSARAPAWARHLAEQSLAGKPIDPQAFADKEARAAAQFNIGLWRTYDVASGAGADILDVLAKAAADWEGQFGKPAPGSP